MKNIFYSFCFSYVHKKTGSCLVVIASRMNFAVLSSHQINKGYEAFPIGAIPVFSASIHKKHRKEEATVNNNNNN